MKTVQSLRISKKKPTQYGGVFEEAGTEEKIKKIEEETAQPDFWNDSEKAEKTFQNLNMLKDGYYPWKELIDEINETEELIELYQGEDDESLREELEGQIEKLDEKFKPLRLKTLLDGKNDKNNVFLTVHSGAGGNEASDWTQMLMRMYTRWAERHGFKCEVLDMQEDEGGVKSVSLKISGSERRGWCSSSCSYLSI